MSTMTQPDAPDKAHIGAAPHPHGVAGSCRGALIETQYAARENPRGGVTQHAVPQGARSVQFGRFDRRDPHSRASKRAESPLRAGAMRRPERSPST